ncbi:S1 family peptidase [Sphingobacterium griseoflavum]|uniref:Trypsin-like peptidase domain-containing protein n=1 Tax=Sphingobacterium griseoflavum TaxID=1474952 RepID=A0ABQ3HSP1_9SPHI|nr:serine protease [Sphingobacterium griseoflavum]GHE29848.1 hypothetical protein GCM10017764_11120 [Sphingobacterium griseoflavum]
MKKNPYISIFTGVSLLFILSCSAVSQVQAQQARFRNEEANWDQMAAKVDEMPVFSNKAYLEQVSVANNPVEIGKAAKKGKKDLPATAIYSKSKGSVLQYAYSYNCGNCDKVHVAPNATAFFIDEDGLAVTNYHVLEPFIEKKEDGEIARIIAGKKPTDDMNLFFTTYDNRIFTLKEILAYDQANDVAIFRVDTQGVKVQPIPLGDAAEIGATVFALGHPKSNPYYFSSGMVARNYMFNGMKGQGMRMDITADYAVGSSGGPILDEKGNVCGMVSATVTLVSKDEASKPSDVQMVIKRAIPVEAITKLLK